MSFTPTNLPVFTQAFAGASQGLAVSGRDVVSASQSAYASPVNAALAFAEEFDTVWADATTANDYVLEAVQSACLGYWVGRPAVSVSAPDYSAEVRAIIAAIKKGSAVLSAAGITPPSPGGGSSPVPWTPVSGGTYSPAALREQWLLLNDSSNVHLNAAVQDGDVVVCKVTFSPDTGPQITSLDGTVVFEYPANTFVSLVELDVRGQTVKWKYSTAGYSGHAKAYVLWGALGS
jgi:hypothetical protein